MYTQGGGVNYGPFGSMHRDEWVSFIPSHPMGVLAYQEGSLRDFSVTAAPSSVADVEDEAAVAAVDSASVALEPQQFVEVGGTQWCLIPRANLASLNAVLHAFTYQITVLFDAEVQIGLIESPQGTIPA
jgi:hypothetical protein